MPVFLGLDCGGSSTRALALDQDGTRLFNGQGGAANITSTPIEQLRRNLRQATRECPPPDVVCGCFAGLLDDADRQKAQDILAGIFPRAKIKAEPDFVATLKASGKMDICVIAGTGSLVCSSTQGVIAKSGGRGYLLGDAGSAYQFGRDALNAYLDSPSTASKGLRTAVEALFGTLDPNRIIVRLYSCSVPAALLAKLAKPLGGDAKEGFPYAMQSVEKNIRALACVVKEHVDMHFNHLPSVKITLAGGLWKSSGVFQQSFALQVSEAMAGLPIHMETIKRPPVEGAAELAKEFSIGN